MVTRSWQWNIRGQSWAEEGQGRGYGTCGPGVGGPGGWPRGLQRRRDGEAGEAQRGAWRGEEGEILRPLETASCGRRPQSGRRHLRRSSPPVPPLPPHRPRPVRPMAPCPIGPVLLPHWARPHQSRCRCWETHLRGWRGGEASGALEALTGPCPPRGGPGRSARWLASPVKAD